MIIPHGNNGYVTSGSANSVSKFQRAIMFLQTCFQNNVESLLLKSLARISALIVASSRLHLRNRYLHLALEIRIESNTSPCLGLLDLTQNLNASLASECAALIISFHPGMLWSSAVPQALVTGMTFKAAVCRAFAIQQFRSLVPSMWLTSLQEVLEQHTAFRGSSILPGSSAHLSM